MRRNLELSRSEIIEVFRQNFNFPIVDTILGKAVRMPSRDAFIFCNVTGAGYLDNFLMPFTPKGLMKLFYNAFNYNFVTGIFEKTTLKYTPFYISQRWPFVFDSDFKYIVPVEFKSEIELQEYLESIFDKLEKPTDYIIMRVETSKKGNGLESFMEYITAEYFKKQGFIVENQVPLAHAIGSPDFGGYDLSNIMAATNSHLPYGYHIIELAMLRIDKEGESYSTIESYPDSLIVGEAKTSTLEMDGQLRKYLNTGIFDWGLEIHPNKPCPTFGDRGMLTLDDHYKVAFTEPQEQYNIPATESHYSKSEYINWLEDYMKFHLLANLTNDELQAYYHAKTGSNISDQESLVAFVKKLSPKNIINHIDSL